MMPYRPSNGAEGLDFMHRWCRRCSKDTREDPCPLIEASFFYEVDNERYPREWTYDGPGTAPTCTAFRESE